VSEEGEFKKRMRERLTFSVGSLFKYKEDTQIIERSQLESITDHIFDEVRKDFPMDSGFGFNDDGTPIYDVFDWFKKWFGTSK